VSRAMPPNRGDILRLNFDPRTGHKQSGHRPAVVVSNSLYNKNASTVVVCPITSRIRDWAFQVVLPDGLPVTGAVLVDQVRVVDWRARGGRAIGVCPAEIMSEIDASLDVLFKGKAETV